MMRDRRGFHYPLEAVRKLTEWDVNQAVRELAVLNSAARQQQEQVDELTNDLTSACADAMAGRCTGGLLDIDAHRRRHGYLKHVRHSLDLATEALRQAEQECEDARTQLNKLRKFAESLDRDMDARAAEHDQAVAKRSYAEDDDRWLQRQHGKEQP